MVNYKCYRCGYESHIKTIVKRHLERKNICQPTLNNINLEICKEFVLQGISYEEYFEKYSKKKSKKRIFGNDRKSPENDRKSPEITRKAKNTNRKSPEITEKSPEMTGNEKIYKKYTKNSNILCDYCGKCFDNKKKLESHLKKECKILLSFNNIYEFPGNTLGNKIFKNKNAGDIYIIQTDYIENNHFKIGYTKHISKKMCQYRSTNIYEPRLYYYFPCKDITIIDDDFKNKLLKYNINKDIYKGELEEIKQDIITLLKDTFNIQDIPVFQPELKLGDSTKCDKCNKCFYVAHDLINHFNTCNDYKESFNKSKFEDNKCEYCKKIFKKKDNLIDHYKLCKDKIKSDEVNDSMKELIGILNNQLNEQNDKLKLYHKELDKKDEDYKKELEKKDKVLDKQNTQIDELIKKAGITTTNIQNNFKLLSYQNTDISHINDQIIKSCLGHSNFCVPHLVKTIHFNPKKPENHNIYISNIKNNYAMIYDGKKWNLTDRDETLSKLIDDKEVILEQRLEEWIENGNKYPDIMDKFNRYLSKKESEKVINLIKEEIKLLLFNNRKMVTDNSDKLIL